MTREQKLIEISQRSADELALRSDAINRELIKRDVEIECLRTDRNVAYAAIGVMFLAVMALTVKLALIHAGGA